METIPGMGKERRLVLSFFTLSKVTLKAGYSVTLVSDL